MMKMPKKSLGLWNDDNAPEELKWWNDDDAAQKSLELWALIGTKLYRIVM